MVSQHQAQAAGLSYAAHRAKLREAVFEGKNPPDALLIVGAGNLFYLTGFTGSFGALLLTPDAERFLTGGVYATQAQGEVADIPIVVNPVLKEFGETVAETAQDLGVRLLGIENSVSLAWLQGIRKLMRKAKIRLKPIGAPPPDSPTLPSNISSGSFSLKSPSGTSRWRSTSTFVGRGRTLRSTPSPCRASALRCRTASRPSDACSKATS
jgi:hypothetical protein